VNFENIVPIIILLVYVVLVFLKQRRLKPGKEERDDQKMILTSFLSRIFSIFGKRAGSFSSSIDEIPGINQELDSRNLGVRNFDCFEQPMEPEISLPWEKADFLAVSSDKESGKDIQTHGRVQKKGFSNLPKSRRVIRNAIVLSEILAPPVALGREKRPWEQ